MEKLFGLLQACILQAAPTNSLWEAPESQLYSLKEFKQLQVYRLQDVGSEMCVC